MILDPGRRFIRATTFTVWFSLACLAIALTQLILSPLWLFDRELFRSWIVHTKEAFGIVATTITEYWAPTPVRVTAEGALVKDLQLGEDGLLQGKFPDRLVLIANHQLYTDWLYLWWFAYACRRHGAIHIILKKSLKHIPIVGWGMQYYGFIFLARNWLQDKTTLLRRLLQLQREDKKPLWLMIFPEGTNYAPTAYALSSAYADKTGVSMPRNVLLPRSTGLFFCLQNLSKSVEWVYDCTFAYENVPRRGFGQDYYSLAGTFFYGSPPKKVHMHWRRFPMKDVPLEDEQAFEEWLQKRWEEKDALIESYYDNGKFKGDAIETSIKLGSIAEVLKVFDVLLCVVLMIVGVRDARRTMRWIDRKMKPTAR